MITAADRGALEQLRARTRARWSSALRGAKDAAILDAPNQRNAGDSLIFAGELAYLDSLGVRVRYISDIEGFDPEYMRRRMPQGVVLMHGGGNFGDVWAGHQLHRERVARAVRDYPIIVLPQSIFYHSHERARTTNDTLRDHPDYQVMVRDRNSLARAEALIPDVRFTYCEDAAFGWEPRPLATTGARDRVLVIARADRESASGLRAAGDMWSYSRFAVDIEDWNPRGSSRITGRLGRGAMRFGHFARDRRHGGGAGQALMGPALRLISGSNLRSARSLYAGARAAVVDRLHAHVLAILLGVPHVVLDQTYGKVAPVFNEYSGEFSTAHFASNLDEASRLLREVTAQ